MNMAHISTAIFILGIAAISSIAADRVVEWTGKPWMGKWETTGRQENMEQYVSKLGVHSHIGTADPNAKTFTKFFRLGDEYHHKILVPTSDYTNNIAFKLDEEGTATYNGTQFKYKYVEKDGALVGTFTYGSKVVENTYQLDGEELVKIGKVDGITAKRWSKRQQKHHKGRGSSPKSPSA